MGSRSLRLAGIAGLLLAFLAATLMPRFGLVWHEHEEAGHDHDHANPDLVKLLGVFHGEHTAHATPQPEDGAQTALFDADAARLHVHYVDDTLPVYRSFRLGCALTILRLFLESQGYRICPLSPAIILLARAPPVPLVVAHV